ncbi:glutathione peroxidase [Agromyces sp. Soil535]|uniref:glutathione peroxidase n=1 Tax=Agromyces sp. Soil535 TaxID=1736390 RepID=UPI000700241E|nr:glutathione peroxidase [Agromyces sp. Soil535]KRE23508.1 glutathione peroxidase [Agromyces sp. Soil535]
MDIRDIPLTTIDGGTASLADYDDQVVMVVNVASRCGLTPQYEKLEALQREYGDRGFTVLGFPCNQFAAQEPGTAEDIKEFCSMTYGVTFPLMSKVKVNGRHRHPLYVELTKVPDAAGKTGRVKWNFEKFLVLPGGEVMRFRPQVQPDDPKIVAVIERGLDEAAAA